MNKKKNTSIFLGGVVLSAVLVSMFATITPLAFGDYYSPAAIIKVNDQNNQQQQLLTEVIPIDGTIGIEKTILNMHVSSDNKLPWGFVEGKIANHVSDYPVIIQMYDDVGHATHFGQIDVEEDGSYEYKFRVRAIDNGNVVKIFEGDYSVSIFKVVYLQNDLGLV